MRIALSTWRRTLGDAGRGLRDLAYPRGCAGCDAILPAERTFELCPDCEAGLAPVSEPYCSVCAQPFAGQMSQGFRCSNCEGLDLAFDFAMCGCLSRGLVRELVHRFKYRGELHLRSVLVELLRRGIEREARFEIDGAWWVVPVPLYSRRQREREYNQADELARGLVRNRPWRLRHALKRVRETRRQARLDRRERLRNLEGAFALTGGERRRRSLEGRDVLLIDDVLTTGTTASACASVLRAEAGARKVVVATVVRG